MGRLLPDKVFGDSLGLKRLARYEFLVLTHVPVNALITLGFKGVIIPAIHDFQSCYQTYRSRPHQLAEALHQRDNSQTFHMFCLERLSRGSGGTHGAHKIASMPNLELNMLPHKEYIPPGLSLNSNVSTCLN